MAKYKVNANNQQGTEKWESLMETNMEVRTAIMELANNFAKLKALIIKNKIEDEELKNIMNGVEATIREIAKELDNITKTHSKEENKDGKRIIKFKAGEVDLNNDKEVAVFISAAQAYVGILEKIANVHQTGIMSMLSRYAELTGENLPNGELDTNKDENATPEVNNGESTTEK